MFREKKDKFLSKVIDAILYLGKNTLMVFTLGWEGLITMNDGPLQEIY